MFFAVGAFVLWLALGFAIGTYTLGDPDWARYLLAVVLAAIAAVMFVVPLRGICWFSFDGSTLAVRNLVTGRRREIPLDGITGIGESRGRYRGIYRIRLECGGFVVIGLWGISNVDRLVAAIRRLRP